MIDTEGMTEREIVLEVLSDPNSVLIMRRHASGKVLCGPWSRQVSLGTLQAMASQGLISRRVLQWSGALSKKGRAMADRRRAEREKVE
jgi:hypothetical protein